MSISRHNSLAKSVGAWAVSLCAVVVLCADPAAAGWKDDTGYNQLAAELSALGLTMPTGAGVGVAQIEAHDSSNNFMPNTALTAFAGKTITSIPAGASGVSDHATQVGMYFYGQFSNDVPYGSAAPGVTSVNVYEANNWMNSKLKLSFPIEPSVMAQRVQNYSWTGDGIDVGTQIEVVQRFDYMLARDGIFAAVGTDNVDSGPVPGILASSYNAIVVGQSDGLDAYGHTQIDMPGRIKPDIVAPANLTSWATPMVSGTAAMLLQVADLDPNLAAARHQPQVIKAILMAGADKNLPTWNWHRDPLQPLDTIYGAGQLNVYNSYHILKAGQHPASSTATVGSTGWDYADVTAGSPQYYYFDIAGSTDRLSVLLSWNRVITDSNPDPDVWTPSSNVPNLNLRLCNATGFALGSEIDSSVSAVDNVQCIYQTALPAGRYALEVTAVSGSAHYALAWQSTITTYATGDFNHDGYVNADDIDLLYRNYGSNSFYDLTADGMVNQADATQLVTGIMGTKFGDANLDHKVNFTDFQTLLNNWTGTGGWASGDFSGDGRVNFPDFQMLLDNWSPVGVSSGGPQIPEPGTCVLLMGGAILIVLRYRGRRK